MFADLYGFTYRFLYANTRNVQFDKFRLAYRSEQTTHSLHFFEKKHIHDFGIKETISSFRFFKNKSIIIYIVPLLYLID